jgi:phage shock protein B
MEAMSVSLIGVLFLFCAIGFPVACWTIIKVVKILKGGGKKERKATAEETKMIQELHSSMEKLEDRIESLETILAHKKTMKGD